MNGRVSLLIHKYARTYAQAGQGAGREMERIAKRQWNAADRREKRRIESAMEIRIKKSGR